MPTCQEWLELIDAEGQIIDDLVAEKEQIDQQILAHSGILYSYVMQYQTQCMVMQASSEPVAEFVTMAEDEKTQFDLLVKDLRQQHRKASE